MSESRNNSAAVKQSTPEEFDLVILGGGTGSTLAAWTFAAEGRRVAAIDRRYIGGSCPNIACLPSKNVIHSAKVAWYFRHGSEFGISDAGFSVDMRGVRGRKRQMVKGLNEMYLESLRCVCGRRCADELPIGIDIFRGRYRTSFERPSPIKPDASLEYKFALPLVNRTILPGHRLMAQVPSTAFPLYDRNPQKFVPNIFDAKPGDCEKATQRAWHEPGEASYISLPVVPISQ